MAIVAAIQMASTHDVKSNLSKACDLIAQAAKKGAKLAVLPEEFVTLGVTPQEKLAIAEPFRNGEIQHRLAKAAKDNGIWVIGGTIPLLGTKKNKVFASCMVWDDSGVLVKRYNKIHMFDVNVEGGEIYRESDVVESGEEIHILDTPVGKIGLAVCYDLRFPELFRNFMLQGVEIFVLPSAFTIKTGKAHWEILLKARAIENLCYMVAPNEVGIRANGLGTYGHTMIIGPWGDTLGQIEAGTGIVTADINLENLHHIRKQFPALTHYRSFVMQQLLQK